MKKSAAVIVRGGIGDQLLTLPALRWIRKWTERDGRRLVLFMDRAESRARLLGLFLGDPGLPIHSAPPPPGAHLTTECDWAIDFDFRSAAGMDRFLTPAMGVASFFSRGFTSCPEYVLSPNRKMQFHECCLELAAHAIRSFYPDWNIRGHPTRDSHPELYRPPSGLEFALAEAIQRGKRTIHRAFPDECPYAVLSIGGRNPPEKKWSVERFMDLALELLRRDMCVLVLAGAGDSDLTDRCRAAIESLSLLRRARADSRLVTEFGDCSLEEIVFLLVDCRIHIGNDSAVAHVAGALGVEQIVLYLGRVSRHHTLCSDDRRIFSGKRGTMEPITVADVIAAVEPILHRRFTA